MRYLPMCLILALAACIAEPKDGVPYDPPPIYREWFARVEQCSARTGRFDHIQWYLMDGDKFMADGQMVIAMWYPSHRIYVAAPESLTAFVVQHEMLHDVLNGGGHPTAFDDCALRR